jgi:predicted DCC family thiol-disulfide oxidoreductase YuxK
MGQQWHGDGVNDPHSPGGPLLVFDGGCLFCRHFAELSELRSGIAGLRIRDGRADHALRRSLEGRGYPLRDGAVLIDGERVLHGAEAIGWICARMRPSAALLRLLAPLMADPARARAMYPLLLAARRMALAVRGLPLDPGHDQAPAGLLRRVWRSPSQAPASAEGTGRGW